MKHPALPDKMLVAAAKTFKQRFAVYGPNWYKVGGALHALFPDGITLRTPADHMRFYHFILLVMKLSRYAQNFHKGGHRDSIHDIILYGAFLETIDTELFGSEQLATKRARVPNIRRRQRKRLGRGRRG